MINPAILKGISDRSKRIKNSDNNKKNEEPFCCKLHSFLKENIDDISPSLLVAIAKELESLCHQA